MNKLRLIYRQQNVTNNFITTAVKVIKEFFTQFTIWTMFKIYPFLLISGPLFAEGVDLGLYMTNVVKYSPALNAVISFR